MRIITGKAKGLKLFTPKEDNVRPTADRVKESVFNIIGTKTRDAIILDLFAGTGNLGLEAWSRGAKKVVFVDESRNSILLTCKNIEKVGAEDMVEVIKNDALTALKDLARKGMKFDFIFIDPPYNKGLVKKIIQQVIECQSLVQGGYLVIEHTMHEKIDYGLEPHLEEVRRERYGETIVTFLRWQ